MLKRIKSILRPYFFYCGLPFLKIAARRIIGKRHVFILLYHKVRPQTRPLFGTSVHPDIFERQIRFLQKNYEIVDLTALNHIDSPSNASKDTVILTFDDGYKDNYDYAFPILNKLNVPATIFLATDYIGTNRLIWHDKLAWIMYGATRIPDREQLVPTGLPGKTISDLHAFFSSKPEKQVTLLHSMAADLKIRSTEERDKIMNILAETCEIKKWPGEIDRPMLSWAEVREMSEQGISFGGHTRSHMSLGDVPENIIREEIHQSKIVIEHHTGKPVNIFAYPYGKKEDYSDSVFNILQEEGFLYALSTSPGHEELPFKNPMELKRKGVPLSPFLFY